MDEKRELHLTPELLDFVRACALREARKRCPPSVEVDDAVQEVIYALLDKPPIYDPSRGASEKTLLTTIIPTIVAKYVAREMRHASRFSQVAERETAGEQDDEEAHDEAFPVALGRGRDRKKTINRRVALFNKSSATDDVLTFLDDDEQGRALCRLVIECGGNLSEAARRLGLSEGTVRYRLRLLAPKLRKAGFHPVEGMTWEDEEE